MRPCLTQNKNTRGLSSLESALIVQVLLFGFKNLFPEWHQETHNFHDSSDATVPCTRWTSGRGTQGALAEEIMGVSRSQPKGSGAEASAD